MRASLAIMLVPLAGCATGPVTTVKVPVPVECRTQVPERPDMPTAQFEQRPAIDAWVQAAIAEIERREAYEIELRAALQACVKR